MIKLLSVKSHFSPLTSSVKEEIALVKKAQKDINSFAVLYEKYFEKVYKFFHFRLRNDQESEDLTSETFTKAVKNLHSFKDQGYPFSAWLFRIAHNILVDYYRRCEKKPTDNIDDLMPGKEPSMELDVDMINNSFVMDKAKEIIATLPKLHQDIWALKLGSDLSNKEIAAALSVSPNSINVTLFRSIKVIKKELKRYRF